MHPSKVQQSTTKQADSGLILGFNPLKKDANGNVIQETAVNSTPSKATASPHHFGTPGYEFKFSCQDSQLSDEAKRLMESVRGDVARIKSQMAQDKGKQMDAEQEADGLHGSRKIAKPKGKVGRFSDVHMAEFKKMDSIAGHASAYRATPGRFQPAANSANPLKRTNSKARLDEPEDSSPSKQFVTPAPVPIAANAKRVKHDNTGDASSRRPTSKDGDASRPVTPRPKHTIRSSLMTPTKASLARSSASAKPTKTSKIPSLARSPAQKAVASPRTPRTDFNPKFKSNVPTLSGLKSILRRHNNLFSKDSETDVSDAQATTPSFNSNMLLTGAHDNGGFHTPSPRKHVNFSSSTKSRYDLAQASPSPSKIPGIQRPMESDVVYPTLPNMTPQKEPTPTMTDSAKAKSTIRQVRQSDAHTQPIPMAELPGVPHGINNKKRRREETEDEADTENVPPVEATERGAKRIKVGTPAAKQIPTPVKPRPNTPRGNTPLRATPGRAGTPASARQRKVGLSLSRLNMLSKPKNRS